MADSLNKKKLFESMSPRQFDNGYWYVAELKDFAKKLGIPNARKLRKNELETAIKTFMMTGTIKSPTERQLPSSGEKDIQRGLSLDLPVTVYTSDGLTKSFIDREARALVPGLKRKTGVLYRLNRWREHQMAKGSKITYGDLVDEYVRLNQRTEPFEKIPHGRYINFSSEFLAAEDNASRADVTKAWETLKTLNIPKDYRSWKEWESGGSGAGV